MGKFELKSYLEEREIYILNEKVSKTIDKNWESIFTQIENIVLFQSKVNSYKENLLPRIGGSIGREINNYNSQIILLRRYLKEIENKSHLNLIDFYLIKNGEYLLNKGKKALNNLYSSNYRSLIERSMKNYEVCLGRVDENNLIVSRDNKIFIGTIKYLTYNIKEHDIYSYIKKIKRKDTNIDIEEIINFYVTKSNLEEDSKEYLRSLSAYPNEEFKIMERYILGKLNLKEEEIIESLYKARKMDSRCLLI